MSKPSKALASIVATAALVVAGPAAAEGAAPPDGISGGLTISVHTHSNDDPTSPTLLFDTDRLAYDFAQGDTFAYSSRPCDGPAAFNDIGLDFTPDYPGVDDATGTASVRHLAEGTITSVNGDRGTIEGTITSVLCQVENGVATETGNAIVSDYTAMFRRTSDNEVQLTGRFVISPTESTGTFAGMTGQGSLRGQLTCLSHERNPSLPSCEQLGYFTDFVGLRGNTAKPAGETTPGLVGHFSDPTITAP